MDKNLKELGSKEQKVRMRNTEIEQNYNVFELIEAQRKENKRGRNDYVNCIVPYKNKIYMSQVKLDRSENGIFYATYHNIEGTINLIKSGKTSFLIFNPIHKYNVEDALKEYNEEVVKLISKKLDVEYEKASNIAQKYHLNIEKRYVYGKPASESANKVVELYRENKVGYYNPYKEEERFQSMWDMIAYKNYNGKNILNAKEDEFENAIANSPGIWGVVDRKTGEVLFEPQFLYIPTYAYFDTFVVYKGDMWKKDGDVYKSANQKCGVIDLKGNEVIPFEYEHIKAIWKIGSDESEKRYIACKNKKWGVINQKNEIIVPFEYDAIVEDTYVASYSMFFMKDGKTEYISLLNDNIVTLNNSDYIRELAS